MAPAWKALWRCKLQNQHSWSVWWLGVSAEMNREVVKLGHRHGTSCRKMEICVCIACCLPPHLKDPSAINCKAYIVQTWQMHNFFESLPHCTLYRTSWISFVTWAYSFCVPGKPHLNIVHLLHFHAWPFFCSVIAFTFVHSDTVHSDNVLLHPSICMFISAFIFPTSTIFHPFTGE